MSDRNSGDTTEYLRTHEAALRLGISPRTLEKYRSYGTGPIFRKIGGCVLYAIDDLKAYMDQATCRSTSEPRYSQLRKLGRKSPQTKSTDRSGR